MAQLEPLLKDIAVKVVHNLKELLSSKGIDATGNLSNSINYKVSPYMIEIEMLEYGEFVDSGTKPHWVPIDKLKPWAKIRGVNPWAVRASIAKKGTKAKPWLGEFKRTLLDYDEDILHAYGIIIEQEFDTKIRKVWQ